MQAGRQLFRWAHRFPGWLALILLMSRAASASPAEERATEGALLHLRLDLSGVQMWTEANKSWRPLERGPARLLVLNLFSKHCPPCLREFPMFREMVNRWRAYSDVRFLFVADPPEETSAEETVAFWQSPLIDAAGGTCPPQSDRVSGPGSKVSCRLQMPAAAPGHSANRRLRDQLGTSLMPLTLLLDQQGVVRQVFAGSLAQRGGELHAAIERLLKALPKSDAPETQRSRLHARRP